MIFLTFGDAFDDIKESLEFELKDDSSNSIIVLGVHYFPLTKFYELKKKYDKVIVYNFEQLTCNDNRWITKEFYKWIKLADEVWDYDEKNINEVLQYIRPDVKLHVLKPYKDWSVYQLVEKDIDILFYGSLNTRRNAILDNLKKKYKVVICNGNHGTQLDPFIMRSKILLNIHFYGECLMQEQARMIRWIGAPCRIISEKSWKNYLGVEEMNYEDLFNKELVK